MGNMLQDHESNSLVKALVVADSGSGKTGSLASLIDAGFNLRFLDFDNGLSVLKGYVKDLSKLKNVHYVDQLVDDYQLVGGRIGVKTANAFQRAMDALERGGEKYWGASGAHIGPVSSWTSRDVLVVDSLTFLGRSCLLMVMQANGKGMAAPEIQHYGTAMENVEKMLGYIKSPKITPCHVIVNTHLTKDEGSARMLPEALGSKLSPKVPRYFDNMISLSLTNGERTFKTKKDGMLSLKTAVPLPDTLPISTGWVTMFEALTGKKISELLA